MGQQRDSHLLELFIARERRAERGSEGERERALYSKMMLEFALVFCFMVITLSAQRPSTEGFINIDCGLNSNDSYTEGVTGFVFSPDEPFTTAGENSDISPIDLKNQIRDYYTDVRSFPDGTRNCYTLKPVINNTKYRIVAEFLYGNYDGLNRYPTFDLYLDVNFWTTVVTEASPREEIITQATRDSIDVCLVNTNKGTPFISALMLRPIPIYMYSEVTSNQSLLVDCRLNYGGQEQILFPEEPYDRFWRTFTLGLVINTSMTVKPPINNGVDFPMPSYVLKTAVTTSSLSENLNFTVGGTSAQKTYVYLYFAELQQLTSNETREFNIYVDDRLFYDYLRPVYLQSEVLLTSPPGLPGGLTYYLTATKNSTLPPMINALEAFIVQEVTLRPTDQIEVNAMLALKRSYGVIKNWQGDPCLPESFTWDGVKCSMNASKHSSITSLDLSGSRLRGPIPPSIVNLTGLTSLNLSNNNLTGEIPPYIGDLPMLIFLNLERNNLSGFIPESVSRRVQDRSLELRINRNPILCSNAGNLCKGPKNSNVIIIAIVVSLVVAPAIAGTVACFIFKRRRAKNEQANERAIVIPRESRVFSASEIAQITNNYVKKLGEGAFGVVYHGFLEDMTDVAVKRFTNPSVLGVEQFITEVKLLTHARFKHVVTLLGYSTESLALVYEYVPMGSLQDNLSDNTFGRNLGWSSRVRIALETALGIEYLHTGCQPPIVHRDVKPANILLTKKLEVKLADFGVSKLFPEENIARQNSIAGTYGYFDPEYLEKGMDQTSDVYSFGIVLLQIVTGKPLQTNDREHPYIADYVRSAFERQDISKLVDARIQGLYDVDSVKEFIRIALSCASRRSKSRPTIGEVVEQLKKCQSIGAPGNSIKTASSSAPETSSRTVSSSASIYL